MTDTYPGQCWSCNEHTDVRDDYVDVVTCIPLCAPCWKSAGRKAAIEAQREAYDEELRERARSHD